MKRKAGREDLMSESNIYASILFKDNRNVSCVVHCDKCNGINVRVREQQVRSSDEPLSIFVTCKDCGYVGVDMGQ